MNNAYLLTGGNLGDRNATLALALKLIEQRAGSIVATSGIYETAAWGITDQGAFLNQVIELKTQFSALELLEQVLAIEEFMGRKRQEKYGPRIIDIDILFFNNDIINTPNLQVPHPQLQNRRFVLTPLNELAPQYLHPLLHKTINQLLKECTDPLPVKLL